MEPLPPEFDLKFPKNERRVCLMVAWFLAVEQHEAVSWTLKADEHGPGGVDLLFDTAAIPSFETRRRFAVEHTVLEVYPGEMEEGRRFIALLLPLEQAVGPHLPGVFNLSIGPRVLKPIPWALHNELRLRIANWVVKVAPTLADGAHTHDLPSDLPFVVQLRCRDREGSRLIISRFLEPGVDWDAWHEESVGQALKRKTPKLAAEKMQGRRTVLVLESVSGALGSIHRTAPTVKSLRSSIGAPDEILFVETDGHEPPWNLWFIKRDSDFFPDISGYAEKSPHGDLELVFED
jgi:hypothetical protein